jgi:MFS family permease
MPNLMPRAEFASAVAWSSSSWQIATIGGPALGGLLYAFSPAAAFAGTACALTAALVAAFVMRGRKVERGDEPTDLASVIAGLALIFRHKLLPARSLSTSSQCCSPARSPCCRSSPRTC